MATPRTSNRRKMNNRGEIGIGTMIVFIASVLVAAIAAGVLIETSGKLQERSQRTGSEATEQVSSNLKVESMVGKRDSASGGLDDLELYLSLAPGASEFDLAQLRIQISNGTVIKTLNWDNDATPDANEFYAEEVRDADNSFAAATPVMTAGDLVKVLVALDTNTAEFQPRDEVSILMVPEIGAPVETGFVTPNSYGTKTVIALS